VIHTVNRVRSRWAMLAGIGQLPPVVRLLVLTQLAFNIGFYLVLPYLATHLAHDLAMAGWLVGLVLGLRTFSQQGLFFLGGALADRFGAKPIILTGCGIRVAGFVMHGRPTTVHGVIAGALLTGFAAALFSPAGESTLAYEAGELDNKGVRSRSDVFALFSVSSELGAVVGPVLGALLLTVDFQVVCLVAAALFVGIGAAHVRWLPPRPSDHQPEPVLDGWRDVLSNRVFLVFAVGYAGYLVSYNQLYLALPIELRTSTGSEVALGWLFALSSLLVVTCQLPLTAWARTTMGRSRGLVSGFVLMSAAFAVPS
jgi:MFS family permease